MHFEFQIDGTRYNIEAAVDGEFRDATRHSPAETPLVDILESEPELPADLIGEVEARIMDELKQRAREHESIKRSMRKARRRGIDPMDYL